jgi:hypothetical protein
MGGVEVKLEFFVSFERRANESGPRGNKRPSAFNTKMLRTCNFLASRTARQGADGMSVLFFEAAFQ